MNARNEQEQQRENTDGAQGVGLYAKQHGKNGKLCTEYVGRTFKHGAIAPCACVR